METFCNKTIFAIDRIDLQNIPKTIFVGEGINHVYFYILLLGISVSFESFCKKKTFIKCTS